MLLLSRGHRGGGSRCGIVVIEAMGAGAGRRVGRRAGRRWLVDDGGCWGYCRRRSPDTGMTATLRSGWRRPGPGGGIRSMTMWGYGGVAEQESSLFFFSKFLRRCSNVQR